MIGENGGDDEDDDDFIGEGDNVENDIAVDSEGEERREEGLEYDVCLPAQHSYLGNNLRELSGRVLLDDESLVTIPLLSLPGVVLIPGQILPLQLEHPTLISMMLNVIDKERTFGILPANQKIGTTVEIRSYSRGNRDDDEDDDSILRIKAEGRQRFKLIESWRQINGLLMGKVKILCEMDLTHPLKKDLQLINNKGNRYNSRLLPVISRWPLFVYKMYDSHFLMNKINEQIHNWANISKASSGHSVDKKIKSVQESNICSQDDEGERIQVKRRLVTTIRTDELEEEEEFSEDESEETEEDEDEDEDMEQRIQSKKNDFSMTLCSPLKYSFWVAANLPLTDEQRVKILKMSSTIERLRFEYNLVQKCLFLCCCNCGIKICSREDMFSMSIEGPLQNYVNPAGHVHETLTVYKASNLRLFGRSSTDQSWFPGYSWTVCECSDCGHHIGWKFMSHKGTRPEYFWGISRANIQPKMDT